MISGSRFSRRLLLGGGLVLAASPLTACSGGGDALPKECRTPEALTQMATLAGAKALGRNDIGRIAVGAKPDFSLVDLNHPAMQPIHDPLRNLLHCAAERAVAAVYVDGVCVMENDRPTRVDYDGALAELQAVQDFAVRRLQANDPRGRAVGNQRGEAADGGNRRLISDQQPRPGPPDDHRRPAGAADPDR